MKTIKEICPHCDKAIKYTIKEKIILFIRNTIISLLVMLGLLFLFFLSLNGIEHTSYQFAELQYTRSAIQNHDQVRFLAVNITKECNGADKICLARSLFQNMSGIRYIPDSNYFFDRTYDPIYVYNNGDDCEGLAQMYVTFAKSVGVNAKIQCGDRHCVAIVTEEQAGKQVNIVIDLTIPLAYQISDNQRFTDIPLDELLLKSIWS